MTSLWKSTKRVCLDEIPRTLLAAEKDEKRKERLAAVIAERQASDDWHITVKAVGSEDDPLLWDRINNAFIAAKESARDDARQLLKKKEDAIAYVLGDDTGTWEKKPSFGMAVEVLAQRSEKWTNAASEFVKACIVHGCEGGEETYKRLFRACGGSPHVLVEAQRAVSAWNSIGGDLGEG